MVRVRPGLKCFARAQMLRWRVQQLCSGNWLECARRTGLRTASHYSWEARVDADANHEARDAADACRQMAAAAATFNDSSPPGCAIRTLCVASAASSVLTPCPSWPRSHAQGQG